MANKLNTLRDALDAAYPIPDTPHESVKQRARESRTAFIQGWQSCVASTALQAPVREVPDDLQIVPKISTSKMDRAGEAVIEGENHCDCGNYPMPNLEKVFSAMLSAAPLPEAPVQKGGE